METEEEDQKGFAMDHVVYKSAAYQPQHTGHDVRTQDNGDNDKSQGSREHPKADVSKEHLQIHGIGDYQIQHTTYDQLNPDVRDVLSIQDSKYDIQTKKCTDEHPKKIYKDPTNNNDIWEFLPIQALRSNKQTQDSINSQPSQDMTHWTVTSGLLPCVKPEGDGMTRNEYPDDTKALKGMVIKIENWPLDSDINTDIAQDSKVDGNFICQMSVPIPSGLATCCSPIVIQPEQPVLAQTEKFPNDIAKIASAGKASNTTTVHKACVIIPPMETPLETPINCLSRLQKDHHSLGKLNKCSVCDVKFPSQSHLDEHQSVPKEDTTNQCTACGERFSHTTQRYLHKCKHEEKAFKCNVCSKVFSGRGRLTTHQQIHTGEKPYTCTICEKAFTYNNARNRHQKTHTDRKRFKCPRCDKAYSNHLALANHQMTHSGEKPFKCLLCDKRFAFRSQLKIHSQIHKCDVCGKGFTDSSQLNTHLHTHTEEKPNKFA